MPVPVREFECVCVSVRLKLSLRVSVYEHVCFSVCVSACDALHVGVGLSACAGPVCVRM